jgi:hypothetical protein
MKRKARTIFTTYVYRNKDKRRERDSNPRDPKRSQAGWRF